MRLMDRLMVKLDGLTKRQKLENITKALLSANNKELANIIRNVIDNNDKDKVFIVNAAINLGLSPDYMLMNCYYLLDYAIMKNDIPVIITLIEKGANINRRKYSDCSHLHLCAQDNNHVLMKYFIRKGLSVNELDQKKNTPLFVACCLINKECAKILIDNNADIEIRNESSITATDIVLHKLYYHMHNSENKNTNNKKPKKIVVSDLIAIFTYLMEIKNKMTNKELWKIRHICLTGFYNNNQMSIMKILMNKFPKTINIPFDKQNNTYLHQSIFNRHKIFVDFFMNELNDNINYRSKNKIGFSHLHALVNYGYIDHIEKATIKDPGAIEQLSDNRQNILEFAVIPCFSIISNKNSEPYKKSNATIINIIKILSKSTTKLDLQSRNKMGYRAIECAVRYCSTDVIDELISLGFNINESRFKNRVFPTINNNDLIGFATQIDRLDMVKHLVNIGAPIHMYHINKHNKLLVPTCLVVAIKFKRDQCIHYLLNLPESIQALSNNTIKKYLFNIATNAGCTNHEIISKLCPKTCDNKNLQKKCNRYKISVFEQHENKIERNIKNYYKRRFLILDSISNMLSIMCAIYNFSDNDSDLHKITRTVISLEANLLLKYTTINNIYETVADFVDHIELTDIQYCFETVSNSEIMKASDYIINEYFISMKKLGIFKKINRLIKSKNIINTLLNEFNSDSESTDDDNDTKRACSCGCQSCYDSDEDPVCNSNESDNLNDTNNHVKSNNKLNSSDDYYDEDDSEDNYNNQNDDEPLVKNDIINKISIITPNQNLENLFNENNVMINSINFENTFNSNHQLFQDNISENIPNNNLNNNLNNNYNNNTNDIQCNKELLEKPLYLQYTRLTKLHEHYIHKSLYKLRHPIKLNQYDMVYNLLTSLDPYVKNNNNVLVFNSDNKLIAKIFSLSIKSDTDYINDTINENDNMYHEKSKLQIRSKPSRWIRFYSQNICCLDKQDINHMFPFVLDRILNDWPCIERRIRDKIHPDGLDSLLYFYGELLINGEMIRGCFEYFINSNNSVFHRLFREEYKLPQNIRDTLNESINALSH